MHIYDSLNNAGPQLAMLLSSHITDNAHFFVRNHGTTPILDPATHRLKITGTQRELSLSLEEIRRDYEKVTVPATLQCAGNRRDDMIGHAPIDDQLAWGVDAVSHAVWGGARLRDVIERAGGLLPDVAHFAFVGLDQVEGKDFTYGSSVPLEALDQTLLVYEMNGEPLPIEHGGPLRTIVLGYIGARCVKWLSEIHAQATPSDNYFQQVAYKLYPPNVTPDNVHESDGLMLGKSSLNCAITMPVSGSVHQLSRLVVGGYAVAGGERTVVRVDVSWDGGQTWQQADLIDPVQKYTWRRWRLEITLPNGDYELVARAVDSAANIQPEHVSAIWNFKGYMNNAWHRVKVRIEADQS